MTTFTINQILTDGKTASFVDTSDIDFTLIKKTRFLFSVYSPVSPHILIYQNELDQYREYQSLTLTAYTYDNKIVPVGGTIIPQVTGIQVLSGSQMETERYSQPTSFLPTANYTPRIISPENMGIDGETFQDMVGSLTYEQYEDNSPLVPTNVVDGKQYIVTGTGATATYRGNIYRENEVFIAEDNGAISFTAGGTVKVLYGLRFQYFVFSYDLERKLSEIQAIIYRNCMEDAGIIYSVNDIYNNLAGIKFSSIQNYTSAQLMYDELKYLNQRADEILCNLSINN